MKIKRFIASDMTAATNMIKNEFGLAAIILSQREIALQQGGGVEITAGVRDEDLPIKKNEGAAAPHAPESTPPIPSRPAVGPAWGAQAYRQAEIGNMSESWRDGIDHLGQSFDKGLGEVKNLILDLAHRQNLAEKWRDRPELISFYRRLLSTGLLGEVARNLVENAAESANAWGGEIEDHLRQSLAAKLRFVDLSLKPPKVLALVGPSGVGKTSTLVNLGAFYRQRGLKVAAITLDTMRLGAADQLIQYARILGLGVKVCQNRDEFKEALDIFEPIDVVLIDTPSRGFQKDEGRHELSSYLELALAHTLLVLPATMKEEDLKAALVRLHTWREAGLVLTKLDETLNLGNVIGLALSQMPKWAFFSLGPKSAEDFMVATGEKLIDLWLPQGNV
ncbi:MAG: hypothetical protein ACRCTY_00025 [Candidatus Adiutrix sp.]